MRTNLECLYIYVCVCVCVCIYDQLMLRPNCAHTHILAKAFTARALAQLASRMFHVCDHVPRLSLIKGRNYSEVISQFSYNIEQSI